MYSKTLLMYLENIQLVLRATRAIDGRKLKEPFITILSK